MLQEEFFEMTKVTLDSDQYKKVEAVYCEVKMEKKEFCKEWVKIRNSKLLGEIETAMFELSNQVASMEREITHLRGQLKEKDRFHEDEMLAQSKRDGEKLVDFAKRIIRANEAGDLRVYDVVEEECGIAFIIKTKHEAGLPLSEDEIKYMVSKL